MRHGLARWTWVVALALSAGTACGGTAAAHVRDARPRIFLRADLWNGPSVAAIRSRLSDAQTKARMAKIRRRGMGNAVLWLLTGEKAAGERALATLKGMNIQHSTPTQQGDKAMQMAALYDWLHEHPDLDEATRKERAAHMEQWAERFIKYLDGGGATPFYCRTSAVLAGLATLGLALHGDSPNAARYVRYAKDFLCEKFGTIRQVEDGASGGATYAYHWEFIHLAGMVAAFRSASDWDAAKWIQANQGDWLRRQLEFQIWMTYPDGSFVKDGDLWGGSHTDHSQLRPQIDIVTTAIRSGVGRTFAEQMYKRHGIHDYHSEYVWMWLVHYDPTVKPAPLETLGRTAVFSPKLHGFVCWRDSWKPDATVIHFKCGETVDHHGTYDQGKFTIFKYKPLAIKDGAYIGYLSRHHRYYKSPWSANSVVFFNDRVHGEQPHIDFDRAPSWKLWKAKRDRAYKRPPTGVLLETEANEKYARALGDLTGASPKGTVCKWTRELVFLGYKYLLVLDRVKPGEGLESKWLLHTIHEPKIEGNLLVADNAPGRLFCRTLLPTDAKLEKVGGPGKAFLYKNDNRPPKGWPTKKFPESMHLGQWRLTVQPAEPTAECVYLHVLYPTDTKTDAMPACSMQQVEAGLRVTVGDLSYTFKNVR